MTKPSALNDKHWRVAQTIAFAMVFYLAGHYLLTHFYTFAYMLDSGLLAQLMWKNLGATSVHTVNAGTYYASHQSIIFTVLSLISFLLPFNHAEFFSLVIGSVYGFAALLFVKLFRHSDAITTRKELLFAVLISVLLALSELMLTTLFYPHFEQAIPVAIGFFFYFLLVRPTNTWALWLSLFITLTVREDGALHLTAVLSVLGAMKVLGARINISHKAIFKYGGICIAYFIAITMVAKWFWDKEDSLARIYFGTPIFSHLSRDLVTSRWRTFVDTKTLSYYPFLFCVVFALRFRDPILLAGYCACIPWFLLNLLAVADIPGRFEAHYQFPFYIGTIWLITWFTLHARRYRTTEMLLFTFFVSIVGLNTASVKHLFNASRLPFTTMTSTHQLVSQLERIMPSNDISSDIAVAALVPHKSPRGDHICGTPIAKSPHLALFSVCNDMEKDRIREYLEQHHFSQFANPKNTFFWIAYDDERALQHYGFAHAIRVTNTSPSEFFLSHPCTY